MNAANSEYVSKTIDLRIFLCHLIKGITVTSELEYANAMRATSCSLNHPHWFTYQSIVENDSSNFLIPASILYDQIFTFYNYNCSKVLFYY